MWIPLYGATQSQVQRYLSLPSLRSCRRLLAFKFFGLNCVMSTDSVLKPSTDLYRRALWMNMVGLMVVVGLCSIGGLVIYAKYFECDPLKNKVGRTLCALKFVHSLINLMQLFEKDVTSPDQLLPFMVMETSGNIPGLPGLFVAGLTCASLRYK